MQTNSGTRGQFTRFAVHVNLAEPFVSKVRIAQRLHRVEYEFLPSIFFHCGCCGHVKGDCPYVVPKNVTEGVRDVSTDGGAVKGIKEPVLLQKRVENEVFGDWMIVQRRH